MKENFSLRMKLFSNAIRQKSIKDSRVLISIGNSSLSLNEFLNIVQKINYTNFVNDAIDFYTIKFVQILI